MALGAHFTPPPPSSVSAPFYGYLKLELHRSEESRSRRWSHRGSNWKPPAPMPRTNQLSYACSLLDIRNNALVPNPSESFIHEDKIKLIYLTIKISFEPHLEMVSYWAKNKQKLMICETAEKFQH